MTPKLFAPLATLKQPPQDALWHHCSLGHDSHQTFLVDRRIGNVDLKLEIYDWREYFITVDGNETVSEHGKYCTGQDIISYCIDKQNIWEAEETGVQLDILNEPQTDDKIMLDFGSHIGYYTMLAAKKGFQVASFDSSKENLELLQRSAVLNEVADKVHPYLCWLDDQAPIFDPTLEKVRLAKIDIEGAERHAIQMLAQLIGQHQLKYLIMEVSPVFNDTYPSLVETICSQHYDVYLIDSRKDWEHRQEFDAAPLATTLKYSKIPAEGREEYVASLHQENFLFVRRDQ